MIGLFRPSVLGLIPGSHMFMLDSPMIQQGGQGHGADDGREQER